MLFKAGNWKLVFIHTVVTPESRAGPSFGSPKTFIHLSECKLLALHSSTRKPGCSPSNGSDFYGLGPVSMSLLGTSATASSPGYSSELRPGTVLSTFCLLRYFIRKAHTGVPESTSCPGNSPFLDGERGSTWQRIPAREFSPSVKTPRVYTANTTRKGVYGCRQASAGGLCTPRGWLDCRENCSLALT